MIQRVQSIYLLLITVLMIFLIMWPFAEVTIAGNQVMIFHAHAITCGQGPETTVYSSMIPVFALAIISALMSLITLFLYKKRKLQMKLCRVNNVWLVLLAAAMAFYYYRFLGSHDAVQHAFRLVALNPLIAIIVNIMAYQAIRHDEMLVSSYNRIR